MNSKAPQLRSTAILLLVPVSFWLVVWVGWELVGDFSWRVHFAACFVAMLLSATMIRKTRLALLPLAANVATVGFWLFAIVRLANALNGAS